MALSLDLRGGWKPTKSVSINKEKMGPSGKFPVYLLVLTGIVLGSRETNGVEKFESPNLGFSMPKPRGWIEAKDQVFQGNLEKYDWNEEIRLRIAEELDRSMVLVSYYKYHPESHAGLIPTITVIVQRNPGKDFRSFEKGVKANAVALSNKLDDFEFLSQPSSVEVSGVKAVYFVGKYSLAMKSGRKLKVRSAIYAIPNGKTMFQVSFMDGDGEDCKQVFSDIVETMRISPGKL